jgi:hypothetical protein
MTTPTVALRTPANLNEWVFPETGADPFRLAALCELWNAGDRRNLRLVTHNENEATLIESNEDTLPTQHVAYPVRPKPGTDKIAPGAAD